MRSDDPFSNLRGPSTRSESPLTCLEDWAMRSGVPVAQDPLRHYQGASLVALFHPKGSQSQGPSCAQGALQNRCRKVGTPRLPKGVPPIQGPSQMGLPPPPTQKYLTPHWSIRSAVSLVQGFALFFDRYGACFLGPQKDSSHPHYGCSESVRPQR